MRSNGLQTEHPRRREPSGHVGRLVLFLALLLGLSTSAAADWREDFAAGVKARDQGDWGETVTLMRRAVQQKPRATGEKVRIYGMKYERYIPYYYLSVALYNVGDCRGALEAIESSRSYGHAGPPARAKMKGLERECRSKVTTTTTSVRRSTTTVPRPTTTVPRSTTTVPRSTTTVPRSTTTVPRSTTTMDPYRVRSVVVREKAEEVRRVLRSADEVANAIHRHLEDTREAAFRRKPSLRQRYEEGYRELNRTRSLLRAAESEGDVAALDTALTRSEKALGELREVAQEIGVK